MMYLIIYNKDNRSLSRTLLCTHDKSSAIGKFLSIFLSFSREATAHVQRNFFSKYNFFSSPEKKLPKHFSCFFERKNSTARTFPHAVGCSRLWKTFSLSPSAVLLRVRGLFVLSQYLLFVWSFQYFNESHNEKILRHRVCSRSLKVNI
jgi:hypothetical protein